MPVQGDSPEGHPGGCLPPQSSLLTFKSQRSPGFRPLASCLHILHAALGLTSHSRLEALETPMPHLQHGPLLETQQPMVSQRHLRAHTFHTELVTVPMIQFHLLCFCLKHENVCAAVTRETRQSPFAALSPLSHIRPGRSGPWLSSSLSPSFYLETFKPTERLRGEHHGLLLTQFLRLGSQLLPFCVTSASSPLPHIQIFSQNNPEM